MYKRILMLSAMAAVFGSAVAKVKLPHLIGDNMVIQQNTDVRLWGSARPGATVKVAVSWSESGYEAAADGQGRWQLTVKSPKADGRSKRWQRACGRSVGLRGAEQHGDAHQGIRRLPR